MSAMKAVILALALGARPAHAASPIGKIIQMLTDQQNKLQADGATAQKIYEESAEFCDDRYKELGFEIKTSESQVAELTATIDKSSSTMGAMTAKIEELAASIAGDEADLKSATAIREKENADFVKDEKELVEVVGMLERAVGVLEREMAKGGAAMLQLQRPGGILQALAAVVQASALSAAEGAKLTALVQAGQLSEDADEEAQAPGAPAAAAYEGHSGDIISTLDSLKEKAQTNLDEARSKESTALHNFEMLKQSLEDDMKFTKKDMEAAKATRSEAGETKATAEGELVATKKDLAEEVKALADLKQDCMTKAQDFEAATHSRGEELEALTKAKKVIIETTGGAEEATYSLGQASLLQLRRSRIQSAADLASFEAVRAVRDLARKQRSPALAQLAARMEVAVRAGGGGGQDPFAKIKGLVADMIAKLEAAAEADATHEAYCDKEMAEANAKKDDKTTMIERLSTKIDQMSARSAKLKEEVTELQKQLADLTAAQTEIDKLRKAENGDFVKSKADLETGLEGVKLAMKVLREYYAQDQAHESGEGAGAGIVSLLEVVESDISKSLASTVTAEETAQAAYDAETKENTYDKAVKEKDVDVKTKESTSLDKKAAEHKSDRSSEQAELDAVLEYLQSLKKQCIVMPDTYAERKASREAEIAGLKEALSILEEGAMLLQRGTKKALRGPAARRTAA